MKYKIKKIIFKLFLVAMTIFLTAPNVYAWDGVGIDSYGDPLDPMNTILDDLGVDKAELKYSVQTMNVSRQKKTPPQVSLTFEPADPGNGEKVTVVATPTYFMNDTKDLYFTWFLKLNGCDKTNSPSSLQKTRCDLDNDGRVDIEDWKIKAMQIIANDDFNWETANYSSDSDSDGYHAVYGGDDQGDKNAHCYVHDTKSGDEYEIGCGHLFPDAPGYHTGDGTFQQGEEKFWHTDPNTDDTAHTGNPDEANVAGLGINTLTWNYTFGDEVGVVVEGASVEPTHEDDASYRTMWAMPKSMCEVEVNDDNYPKTSTETISTTLDSPIAGQTTTVTQTTTKSVVTRAANIATIRTTVTQTTTITTTATGAQVSQSSSTLSTSDSVEDISSDISLDNIQDADDLNKCLYNNLISPAENGPQSQELKVELSYFPSSPINDRNSYSDYALSQGDDLTVIASVSDAKDENYLQYEWEVYSSDEANPISWGDPIQKTSLPLATQMTGLGLNTFKFKLNLSNPKKYLKIKLTVKENVGNNLFREGHSYVIVPVVSSEEQIRVYNSQLSSSNLFNLGTSEICGDDNPVERAICPVVKNEVVGLSAASGFSNYLWTIDDVPFTCDEDYFSGCSESQPQKNNIAYFPVLKNKGEQHAVNLIATKNSGEKVNLTRTFEVIDPKIEIIPSGNDSNFEPVLLGKYVDFDGKEWPDESKINFQSFSEKPIKLEAKTSGFSGDFKSYVWTVDGNTFSFEDASSYGYEIDDNGVLTLPAKEAGESYDVSVSALYSQSDPVKKKLNDVWGVTYDQFYEKMVSARINIDVKDSDSIENQTASTGQKVLASVYSSMPSYLAFLFKIVLSGFLILFASGFFMSFRSKDYIK